MSALSATFCNPVQEWTSPGTFRRQRPRNRLLSPGKGERKYIFTDVLCLGIIHHHPDYREKLYRTFSRLGLSARKRGWGLCRPPICSVKTLSTIARSGAWKIKIAPSTSMTARGIFAHWWQGNTKHGKLSQTSTMCQEGRATWLKKNVEKEPGMIS